MSHMHRWFRRLPGVAVLALVGMIAGWTGTARASETVPQTWLPGECIPQFAAPLPVFGPGYNAALPRVDASRHSPPSRGDSP